MAGSVTDLITRLLVDDSELDKVDQSKARFDKWSDGLDTAAVASAGALGILGAAAVAASGAAIGLEASSDQLAASLGLTEAQAAVAGESAANAYGNAFGGSLEEVQAATGGVITSIQGMRDASVEELQGITEGVLTLSTGFELEADKISQVVGQMITTGLAGSAQEGLDLLTATLTKVPAAVRGDILDAVDEYGPFFAQIGMTGNDAMSTLVDASEKGMYGIDKAGDAVKEFSIRSTDMSTASVAAYEAAGLSASDMAGKIIAGGEQGKEGFRQTVEGLLSIEDPVARANAAIGLFGTPLEDLGVNEIPQFLEGLVNLEGGMGDVAGATQAMADTAGGNAATSWVEIQRSFELTAGVIGTSLMPTITDLLGGLDGFATWASQNTDVITTIAGVVGVIAGGFVVASAAMKVFAAAQAIQTVAQWASNTAWLASPITWIILAIIVAVGLLVLAGIWLAQNWDAVIAWISGAWSGFMGWIGGAIDGFVGWWNGVWSAVGQFIGDVWAGFIGGIADLWNGFWGWVTGAIGGFGTWIGDTWNGIWSGLGNIVKDVWNGVLGFIEGGVNGAIDLINSMIGAVNDVGGVVGINIGLIPNISIPRLATGTVTNGPMLAMVGDNPGGREVIAPYDAYQAELRTAYTAGQRTSGESGPRVVVKQTVLALPGMDEQQIADSAADKINFGLRGA